MHHGPCLVKGGVGVIGDSLYIKVHSSKNELILDPSSWTGKDASVPEVVVVYGGKVWSPKSLPGGFDPRQSVVISFEREKVRFFDFRTEEGCYYNRSLSVG